MATRLILFGLIVWEICAPLMSPGASADSLEIRSITVNGKPVSRRGNGDVSFGASPENISIAFGARTNTAQPPVRIRYKMDGYDSNWRDGGGDMYLTVRFYNDAGDQIALKNFQIAGESPGWNGSLASSPLTHRRETVIAPPRASRLLVVISSAGPPATVGVYAIANLIVSKISNGPLVLMQSPSDQELEQASNSPPPRWERDGPHASMATIVTLGQNSDQKALAILDEDGGSHAEWHNSLSSAPAVQPGDNILIEWNEAFTTGTGDISVANYQKLPEGNYRFHVASVDVFGNQTGAAISLEIAVPPPFWRTSWFWTLSGVSIVGVTLGAWRYLAWHRTRRELLRLRGERALEQERVRISRDIHDDLGARVTEISLASALAKTKATFPESASADFDRISQLSRELVSALYETVWAVNPENDNLDALGNYLCQMTNHLCEHAQLACRLSISDLPGSVQVSSQLRHNITMAVKEAVHNAIKHSKASEITLQVEFEREVLVISVQDNGCGFNPASVPNGSGLTNMHSRMADIGGRCLVESSDSGTRVQLHLVFPKTHS